MVKVKMMMVNIVMRTVKFEEVDQAIGDADATRRHCCTSERARTCEMKLLLRRFATNGQESKLCQRDLKGISARCELARRVCR